MPIPSAARLIAASAIAPFWFVDIVILAPRHAADGRDRSRARR
jgi:hypothetical protein